MIETHPFPNFIPPKAECLVLGSFPTHKKNWRFNSYYPGRANFFWRMLSEIYNRPFKYTHGQEAADERITLLTEKRIAISDTLYKIKRRVAESSKDSDLIVVELMDVVSILKQAPTIKTVILTGSSGPASAHVTFYQHLVQQQIEFNLHRSTPPIKGWFVLYNRKINCYSLYSTSGINIGRYAEAVKQYKKYLPNS